VNAVGKSACRRETLALLLLLAVTAWVYSPVLRASFVICDDVPLIAENSHVLPGVTGRTIAWAWSDGFLAPSSHIDYWQPVTVLSRLADIELFGLDASGHHLGNLLLHLGSVLLLYALLRPARGSSWPGLLAAALFALHPMNADSVCWVIERKDVLSQFFALATLCVWRRNLVSSHRGLYALALATAALAMLSKPHTVVLPALLLLVEIWPAGTLAVSPWRPDAWRRSLSRLAPFLLLSLFVALVIILSGPVVSDAEAIPLGRRLDGFFLAYTLYPLRLVWPIGLVTFERSHLLLYPAGFGRALGFIPLLVTVLAARAFATRRWLAVGWFWFAAALLPCAVYLLDLETRFAYLPGIGLFIALAWGAAEWAARARTPRALCAAAALLVLAALGMISHRQAAAWRNSETFIARELARVPENYRMHYYRGYLLANQGRDMEALASFERALGISPAFRDCRIMRARALARLGRADEAEKAYLGHLATRPRDGEAHYELGILLMERGDEERALAEYRMAAELRPRDARPRNNGGLLLLRRGEPAAAVEVLRRAVELEPGDYRMQINLANALAGVGRWPEAIDAAGAALALAPADTHLPVTVRRLAARFLERAGAHGDTEAARALLDARLGRSAWRDTGPDDGARGEAAARR